MLVDVDMLREGACLLLVKQWGRGYSAGSLWYSVYHNKIYYQFRSRWVNSRYVPGSLYLYRTGGIGGMCTYSYEDGRSTVSMTKDHDFVNGVIDVYSFKEAY